ncbi:hypothetical protein ABIE41_004429 [Bosea sp. OAE506]
MLREPDGTVRAVEVALYFDGIDGALDIWRFGAAPPEEKAAVEPFRVPRFHRTLSEWVALIVRAGLTIEHMAEPSASPEIARLHPYIADTRVAPLFLHIRVRKPAAG